MLIKKLRRLNLRKIIQTAVKVIATVVLYALGGPLIRDLARGAVGEILTDLRFA